MSVKEIRKGTGLSQAKFAAMFCIPLRTLQSWEQNVRVPPQYVVYMLQELVLAKNLTKGVNQYDYI